MENSHENNVNPDAKSSPSILANTLNTLLITLGVSIFVATLFTAWIPVHTFSPINPSDIYSISNQTSITPTSKEGALTVTNKIGIVAGHWGSDSGAVCKDGLTEQEVNLNIASLVQKNLSSYGYQVDLLKEFDSRLTNYRALALVSIHADSCDYINEQATGFKVAASMNNKNPEKTAALTACIKNYYTQVTGLHQHSTSITPDMSGYHAFDEINPETPATIIETGFLNLDRQILTHNPGLIAKGISDGILCYLGKESLINQPTNEP